MSIPVHRSIGRLFTVVVAAALLTGCASQEQYRRALRDNENLRKVRDDLSAQIAALTADNARLRQERDEALENAVSPEWLAEQEAARAALEELRAGSLGASDVEVRNTAEGLVFDIRGAVLFASGRAEVTQQGRDTLDQLVAGLRDSGRRLRVEGHTDTDPIVNSPWKSNLRLSAERALVVAEYLIGQGVPERRVGIAAYGPFRPKVEGDSDEAKAQNRRVEILVIRDS